MNNPLPPHLTGNAIRKTFIEFFEDKGHTFVQSASLVPGGDATLLFTNAGMVQFKDIFLGTDKRAYTRAANSQKCMRVAGKHNDLEDVGQDDTHHTFFEMLGNWSFGDYYKKEAIQWAWQLLTEVWGLPKERLYSTVFEDEKGQIPTDEEAAQYWRQQPGFVPGHVFYMGRKDNFWEMADTGPCGPCSEIHIDLRPEEGKVTAETLDTDRFVELWNLVFIQYNRTGPDSLTPLPATHVDTGLGFDRIVQMLQKVNSNYRTDLLWPLIEKTAQLSGHGTEHVDANFTPYRVIADHARAAAFLIADGVVPGNMGRNYVTRMIIRRAYRFGGKIGLHEPFMAAVAETVIEHYGEAYPELVRNKTAILATITREEEQFQRTLDKATGHLETLLDGLESQGQRTLSGHQAADLYTTYGMPFEITRDIAQERGLGVDEEGFKEAMEVHRLASGAGKAMGPLGGEFVKLYQPIQKRLEKLSEVLAQAPTRHLEEVLAQAIKAPTRHLEEVLAQATKAPTRHLEEVLAQAAKAPTQQLEDVLVQATKAPIWWLKILVQHRLEQIKQNTESLKRTIKSQLEQVQQDPIIYDPYSSLEVKSIILALIRNGESVNQVQPNDEVEVVLPETSFYIEAGGQVSDTGTISGEDWQIRVTGVRKPAAGVIVHVGEVVSGTPKVGDEVIARVDVRRRKDIMRNHTATHLLHAALHEVLGDHARQAGSLVAPDRLRFDFTHPEAVTNQQIEQIEQYVNEKILEDHELQIAHKSLQAALDEGATALFGEKYGETVRNISIGEKDKLFSNELCGGTHCQRTGEIGTFIITGEGSVAAGIRRIEAVTGREAYHLIQRRFRVLNQAAATLMTTPDQLLDKAQAALADIKSMRNRIADLRQNLAAADFTRVLDNTSHIGGVDVLTAILKDADADTLRQMADRFRQRHPENGVAVLARVVAGRPRIIAAVTRDLVKRGLKAGDLVKFVAKPLGGGGGGCPTLAQAGGRDASKLDVALASVAGWVKEHWK